jgi:hypothetical protein
MKKISILLLIACQVTSVFAQSQAANSDSATIKTPPNNAIHLLSKINIYGIVRSDFYYNSRQMEESSDGFVLLFPKPEKTDIYGEDINAHPMTGLTATGTRFGINLENIRITKLNADITGKIEADFQGFSTSPTMLRIRHAWINMKFKNSDLLIGQYWHPMYEGVSPTVLDLNGGQPYQPFARNPQVKYSYTLNDFRLFAAGVYQTQYQSPGPDANGANSKSTTFLKNSLLPDLNAGIEFNKNTWKFGVSGEFKQLTPRITALVPDGNDPETKNTIAVDEKINSYALAAYSRYAQGAFYMDGKVTYGQNLSDLGMIGGYAATGVNAKGEQSYKAFNTITGWIDANYNFKKNWNISVFGGYAKNLGCDHAVLTNPAGNPLAYGNVLYSGQMLDQVWRASTQLSYQISGWRMALEYSYNKAYYGNMDIADGSANNVEGIGGSRLLAVLMFYF